MKPWQIITIVLVIIAIVLVVKIKTANDRDRTLIWHDPLRDWIGTEKPQLFKGNTDGEYQ